MANTRSAQKRNRQALKRRARNTSVRTGVKNAVKKAREALTGANPTQALDSVKAASRALAKAASKGVLHPRNAARRIARLAKAVHAKAPAH